LLSLGHTAIATGKEVIDNPLGVGLLATQSLPNSALPIAGTLIGGAIGNIPGAITGGFSGGLLTERGAYLTDKILSEVQNRGLKPTEENIASVINDTKFYNEVSKKANLKGVGTAGVDTALSMVGGKLFTGAVGRAMKQASLKLGENASEEAVGMLANKILSETSLTTKVLDKFKGIGTELISEPLSEAAGTGLADHEIQPGELMGETLGAIGTTPIMTAVDKSVFGAKLAKDITNEAFRTKAPEEIQLKEQLKPEYKKDYKEKVDELVKKGLTDEVIKESPVMAIQVLQKISNKDKSTDVEKLKIQETANDILETNNNKQLEIVEKVEDLRAKKDLTVNEKKEKTTLIKQLKTLQKIEKRIVQTVAKLNQDTKAERTKSVDLDEAVLEDNSKRAEEVISEVFGSSPMSFKTDIKNLTKIVNSPFVSERTKSKASKALKYKKKTGKLIKLSLEATKDMEAVHVDVMHGGDGFLGIQDYTDNIRSALKKGNRAFADKQFKLLKKFAYNHKLKARSALNDGTQDRLQTIINIESEALEATVEVLADAIAEDAKKNKAAKDKPFIKKAVNVMESLQVKPDISIEKPLTRVSTTTDLKNKEKTIEPNNKSEKIAKIKSTEVTTKPVRTIKKEVETFPITTSRKLNNFKKQLASIEKKLVEVSKIVNTPKGKKAHKALKARATQIKEKANALYKDAVKHNKLYKLVQPSKKDPENEIKNTFSRKKVRGLIHSTDNVIDNLNKEFLKTTDYFDESRPLDDEALKVVGSIREFLINFTKAFNDSFNNNVKTMITKRALGNKARYFKGSNAKELKQLRSYILSNNKSDEYNRVELRKIIKANKMLANNKTVQRFADSLIIKNEKKNDPIKYLVDENGALHANVINALGVIAYKWLATRAMQTKVNTPERINGIFNKKPETPVAPIAQRTMAYVGQLSSNLHETLGNGVLEMLGLEPTKATALYLKESLSVSLGGQLMSTLETLGMIETIKLRNGVDEYSGLQGVLATYKADDLTKFENLPNTMFVPKNMKNKDLENEGTTDFYRVVQENSADIKKIEKPIIEPYDKSKYTWDRLFIGQDSKESYQLKIPNTGKRKLLGTNFKVPKMQADKVNKQEKKPYVVNKTATWLWYVLPEEYRDAILEKENTNKKMANRKPSVDGKNLEIDLANKEYMSMLHDLSKQRKELDSLVYFNQEIWRMGRIGQVGANAPQGNKLTRGLMSMQNWQRTMDTTNPEDVENFMLAVAFGLDLETTKENGVSGVLKKTETLLNKPEMQIAISALVRIFKEFDPNDITSVEELLETADESIFTEGELASIFKAIQIGKLKTHTLNVLGEYAKFKIATSESATKFKTEIQFETDGVSNGIAITKIQFLPNGNLTVKHLNELQNAGLMLEQTPLELAERLAGPLNHDSYEVTGFSWANIITDLKLNIANKINTGAATISEMYSLTSIEELYGEFRDKTTGNVSKLARKYSKDPTLRTIYGMTSTTLKKETGFAFIEDLQNKAEQIANNGDLFAYNKLNEQVNNIIGEPLFEIPVFSNGKALDNVTRKTMLTTGITDAKITKLTTAVNKTFGDALQLAIKNEYGTIKDVIQPFNEGLNVGATIYNSMLDSMYRLKKQEVGRELTVGEYNEIEARLEPIYPYTETRYGGKIPMAKPSKKKIYRATDGEVLKVDQSYKDKSAKKMYVPKRTGVELPGVGGAILNIHNTDSYVPTELFDEFYFLNNHDGFTTSAFDRKSLAEAANEHFINALQHSIPNAMHEYSVFAREFASKLTKELIQEEAERNNDNVGTTKDVILKTLAENLRQTLRLKKLKTKAIGAVLTSREQDRQELVIELDNNRETILKNISIIEQYSTPGGGKKIQEVEEIITFANGTQINTATMNDLNEKMLKAKMEKAVLSEEITEEIITDIAQATATTVIQSVANNENPNDALQTTTSLTVSELETEKAEELYITGINDSVNLNSRKKQTVIVKESNDTLHTKENGTIVTGFSHLDLNVITISHGSKRWAIYDLATGYKIFSDTGTTKANALKILETKVALVNAEQYRSFQEDNFIKMKQAGMTVKESVSKKEDTSVVSV